MHRYFPVPVDNSGDLDRDEILNVFGAEVKHFEKLKSDEHGKVGILEWFQFIGEIKTKRGDANLDTFLTFLERKVDY